MSHYENHLMRAHREQREAVAREKQGITGPAVELVNMTERVAAWKGLTPRRPEPPEALKTPAVLFEAWRSDPGAVETFKAEKGVSSATIAGYASLWSSVVETPSVASRMRRGAFKRSIQQRQDTIKILHGHDQDKVIGVPLELREDGKGLYVRASLNATSAALDIVSGMQHAKANGKLSTFGFSIGFDVLEAEYVETKTHGLVREVSEARLWEISIVGFGADSDARVSTLEVASASWRSKGDLIAWSKEDSEAIAELDVLTGDEEREFDEIIRQIPVSEFYDWTPS